MRWRLLDETKDKQNRRIFDHFMETHPKGHILQTWEWGEVKKGAWTPLYLVIEDDQKEIIAACLLLKRRLPLKLGTFFYAPRGPVLDIENKECWDFLWQSIKELARKHDAVFCKIDPDVPALDETWALRLKESGFVSAEKGEGFEGVQPRHVFRLDISPDEETLLANMHQKTRYNIRLAARKGVTVEKSDRAGMKIFYPLLQETAQRDNFLIRSENYFTSFYDCLAPHGLAELFLVHYEDKAISGALLFKLGDKSWYIYGASANKYRNVMPNYLMQWEMICWSKKQGCSLYDFRGVPGDVPSDHPLYGLVKFKKGFGGEYVSFIGEYDLVFKPSAYKFYNFAEPIYQKNIRRWIRFKKRLKGENKQINTTD
ncbi:MAG: lipid II:glycine glycyltransferase FemX [Bacillota bacterium]|jgi:peptidoglycan pentaglycine glycine transferase (the first glycine)